MPPPDEAAREAYRERRRKVHEEWSRPPTPQEAREIWRRDTLSAIGCLLPMPTVAAVAGVAVVIAGEAIPIAIVATVVGTLTGWLVAIGMYFIAEWLDVEGADWDARSLRLFVTAQYYLPFAAAFGATLLVSRIL